MSDPWPLFHFDDQVDCFRCGAPIGAARDGEVVGFGDGHGNRVLKCKCDYRTFYDATRSVEERDKFNAEHAPALADRKASMDAWWARKEAADAERAGRRRSRGNVPADRGDAVPGSRHVSSARAVLDPPSVCSSAGGVPDVVQVQSTVPPVEKSAFDLEL